MLLSLLEAFDLCVCTPFAKVKRKQLFFVLFCFQSLARLVFAVTTTCCLFCPGVAVEQEGRCPDTQLLGCHVHGVTIGEAILV